MQAAWGYCGTQLWAVLVTPRDVAYSTESSGGELAVELNRREKVILRGENWRKGNHCLGKLNNRGRAAKVSVYCSANGYPNYFTMQHLAVKACVNCALPELTPQVSLQLLL